jgi:hypothetical protein
MFLYKWAEKWKIPRTAIDDLLLACDVTTATAVREGMLESSVSGALRNEAARLGMRLWRNNVGAARTDSGGFIRYGLANDSQQLNSQIKSADLIGIRPVLITQEHVGLVIGQFVSREVKRASWKYAGTAREEAQLRWMTIILTLGGDACFATGTGTL